MSPATVRGRELHLVDAPVTTWAALGAQPQSLAGEPSVGRCPVAFAGHRLVLRHPDDVHCDGITIPV